MDDLTFSQKEFCVLEVSPKHSPAPLQGGSFKGFTFINMNFKFDSFILVSNLLRTAKVVVKLLLFFSHLLMFAINK